MEDEKRSYKDDTKRLILSIVIMLVIVWILHSGCKLSIKERIDTRVSVDNYTAALVFGVLTVAFGSVYFIVGLIVVAEFVLDFATWFQAHDMDKETANNQAREQKTIWQLTIQISVTIASMFLLIWAIHRGYKLAVQGPKGTIHNGLAFLLGFITIGFGFVYFVIGIGLIAESTVYLSSRIQEVIQSDIYEDQDTDAYLAV